MTAISQRDRQREETRRRIYLAALDVFRRKGVAPAHIDDITRAAGVSRASFYFHFPTKEHVLVQLMEESKQRAADRVESLPRKASLEDVLSTTVQAMSVDWQADPKLLIEIGLLGLRQASEQGREAPRDPIRQALTARFQEAIDRKKIRSPLTAAMLADFFLVEALAASLAWTANPDLPLEAALGTVVAVFLHGVAH